MAKTSIIISSRNETWKTNTGETVIQRMVRDIHEKATGDYEVWVTFDGEPFQDMPDYGDNYHYIYLPEAVGLRPALNMMARRATGDYLLKFDSHCSVGEGFDEILQRDMEWNWLVMPRFYVLNAEEWKWQDERFYDYMKLCCPLTDPKGFRFQAAGHWPERTAERLDGAKIDETMQMHGSAWFLSKKFFWECLGGMDMKGYEHFSMEPPELCLKTWLGPWGGKVMVNKNTWYAHMHKGGQRPRGWPLSGSEIKRTYLWCAEYWMSNSWEERAHDLQWLVEKFYPIPTWPENWRELWDKWLKEYHSR